MTHVKLAPAASPTALHVRLVFALAALMGTVSAPTRLSVNQSAMMSTVRIAFLRQSASNAQQPTARTQKASA